MSTIEESYTCDLDVGWIWTHGWVDRRRFKGECLSKASRRGFDTDFGEREIATGVVKHGWVLTVAGDLNGCGWDMTTFFETTEPVIVDGRWPERTTYEDEHDREVDAEVVDGPHKATWLEPGAE